MRGRLSSSSPTPESSAWRGSEGGRKSGGFPAQFEFTRHDNDEGRDFRRAPPAASIPSGRFPTNGGLQGGHLPSASGTPAFRGRAQQRLLGSVAGWVRLGCRVIPVRSVSMNAVCGRAGGRDDGKSAPCRGLIRPHETRDAGRRACRRRFTGSRLAAARKRRRARLSPRPPVLHRFACRPRERGCQGGRLPSASGTPGWGRAQQRLLGSATG